MTFFVKMCTFLSLTARINKGTLQIMPVLEHTSRSEAEGNLLVHVSLRSVSESAATWASQVTKCFRYESKYLTKIIKRY